MDSEKTVLVDQSLYFMIPELMSNWFYRKSDTYICRQVSVMAGHSAYV